VAAPAGSNAYRQAWGAWCWVQAAVNDQGPVVDALLAAGADKAATNKEGQTAAGMAKSEALRDKLQAP